MVVDDTKYSRIGFCPECGADVEFFISDFLNQPQGGLVLIWNCDANLNCKQTSIQLYKEG